jgi:hypothetical protein
MPAEAIENGVAQAGCGDPALIVDALKVARNVEAKERA